MKKKDLIEALRKQKETTALLCREFDAYLERTSKIDKEIMRLL